MSLTKKEERDLAKLRALEKAGVEDWEGYSYALEEWHQEAERAKVISKLAREIIQGVENTVFDAGVSFDFGKTSLQSQIEEMIASALVRLA